MLIAPESVVNLWSDYDIQVLDHETILSAFLDGLPALRKLNSNLQEIMEAGPEREWSANRLKAASYWLSRDCVRRERYFLNVGLGQYLDYDRANLLRTPSARWKTQQSWWSQLFPSWQGFDRIPDGERVVSRVEDIKPWSKAPPLVQGEVVLLDAPLCFEPEPKPMELFLSDYPDFLRRPTDPRVRLKSSCCLVEKLKREIPKHLEWHPFSRTLGYVEKDGMGDCVRVLQISMRGPVHGTPGWATELIEKAELFQYQRPVSEDKWLSEIVSTCKDLLDGARKKSPHMTDAQIREERSAEFAVELQRLHSFVYELVVRDEDTAYEGTNGFWTGVTTVLQDWSGQFPLSAPAKHALLGYFDVAYTNERRSTADLLSIAGVTRFNSDTIEGIKKRLERLGA
jgi:hypothetical protein